MATRIITPNGDYIPESYESAKPNRPVILQFPLLVPRCSRLHAKSQRGGSKWRRTMSVVPCIAFIRLGSPRWGWNTFMGGFSQAAGLGWLRTVPSGLRYGDHLDWNARYRLRFRQAGPRLRPVIIPNGTMPLCCWLIRRFVLLEAFEAATMAYINDYR
jgi:hypothetical protein